MGKETFTRDEIIEAVMNYDEGCPSGKAEFLASALDIEIPNERTLRVVLEIKVPIRDDDYDEIDPHTIGAEIESCLDSDLRTYLYVSDPKIDCRVQDVSVVS